MRGIATLSDEQAYSGLYSYKQDEDFDAIRLYSADDEKSGSIVSVMLYDNMTSSKYMGLGVRVNNGSTGLAIMGDQKTLPQYYSYGNGEKWIATGVKRSLGWHELKLDFSNGTSLVLYIDDIKVGEIDNVTSWNWMVIGDSWGSGGYISNMYFDDLKIYKSEQE